MHQPNHKSEDFFDVLGKPVGVVRKNKNFVAAPPSLTLGEKLVKWMPSKHKDPARAKEQERGLKNLVDFVVPQSKLDIGLTLGTMGPVGSTIGSGIRAAAKYAKPSKITNKFGNIYKIWDQAHMAPNEFAKKKPLTLVDNMTGDEKSALEAGKKVGSVIKKSDGQYTEWIKRSESNDYGLDYTLEKRGLPFKTSQGKWTSEVKSAMRFDLEDVPQSVMASMGYHNIKKPKMIKHLAFQWGDVQGSGSFMDHGRLLRNVFDRFEGNWMVGNSEGNSFTVDSLNMMLKSVLRRADEIRFEPKALVSYGESDLSLVSKAADARRSKLQKLASTATTEQYAVSKADLDQEFLKKLDDYSESIIQTLWRSGKVSGAKSIDDVREMSGFMVNKERKELLSNRFLVTSFKGDSMFSIEDYKYAVAGILGIKVAQVPEVLEQMFPEGE